MPVPPVYSHPGLVRFCRWLVRRYFRFFHFTRWSGQENLPPPGPCLFASNHQSYYDPLLVAGGQLNSMMFMAWDALFNGKRFEKFIRFFGAFPVDPDGGDPGGYRECLKYLREGNRICIFPEGGRSYDGKLMEFREGFARLAMKTNAPIVPVCIKGADAAWPRGDTSPRPWFRINVIYLEPVYPQPTTTPDERHAEADRIREAVISRIQSELDRK